MWLSVLRLNHLIAHNKALKFIWIKEKFIPRLTFNLGLALTDFRTTRACLQQVNLTWAHDPIESRHLAVTSRCSKLEPAIWQRDTGLRIPCLDRCQLITTGISYIKEGRCKPRLHVSVNLFAILTRPRGNSLAMITMKKSIHGLRDDRKTERSLNLILLNCILLICGFINISHIIHCDLIGYLVWKTSYRKQKRRF